MFGEHALMEAAGTLVRKASVDADAADAAQRLRRALGDDLAIAFVFASPDCDFAALAAGIDAAFDNPVIACTTAGEISAGYSEGRIVAIGLPRAMFAARTVVVPDLDRFDPQMLVSDVIGARLGLQADYPHFAQEFAFLLVDGVSAREDTLMDTLAQAIGPVPLFGGSAGDGTAFEHSLLGKDGAVWENAAVLSVVRTACPVRVFSFDHLEPGDRKMVVTRADPDHRLVMEINGAPAVQEYARVLGMPQAGLGPFTFAAHPLVVRVGGRYYVRSIQQATPEGHLKFFSAIDDGVVLTLANIRDIADALAIDLAALAEDGEVDTIIACDCVLRRMAAEQTQRTRAVSQVLAANNVVGFSTYGEQFGAMHVNFTMTGVAIYRPPDPGCNQRDD